MTKAELIEAVAAKAEVTKADAERTLAAFFEQVVAVAKNDDKVARPRRGLPQCALAPMMLQRASLLERRRHVGPLD